jgi:hypothetical protein
MKKDVEARIYAGLKEPGDRILAQLLTEHYHRYHTILAQRVSGDEQPKPKGYNSSGSMRHFGSDRGLA